MFVVALGRRTPSVWGLFLLLNCHLLVVVQAQYEALATLFNTTQQEIIELGGSPDLDCVFRFNNTADNCARLIDGLNGVYEVGTVGTTTAPAPTASATDAPTASSANGTDAAVGRDHTDGPSSGGTTFNIIVDGDNDFRRALQGEESQQCQCYNFCGTTLTGCYNKGENPPIFECDIHQVVAGCQYNQSDKPPVLKPNNATAEPCPKGYMCAIGREKSCDEIRQIPIQLGLGDVHAGIYCPGRSDRLENGVYNCEVGYYCPNSTTMLPCPAGFFCPHKTLIPDIPCPHCPEGAKTLGRKAYGYYIFGIGAILLVLIAAYETFKRYNSGLFFQLKELRGRNMDRVKAAVQKAKVQEKLKRLESKLKIIEKRLQQDSGNYQAPDVHESVKALSTDNDDGRIIFNARRLFSLMDTNKDGLLTFDELAHALDLKAGQMREFMRRMNHEAKQPPDTEHITKDVFLKTFLKVLEQTSHFEPTAQEANELFDAILEQSEHGVGFNAIVDDGDVIAHEDLFESPLAEFLDDNQINRIIKRFRELQENHAIAGHEAEVSMMGASDATGGLDAGSNHSVTPRGSANRRRRSSIGHIAKRASTAGVKRHSFIAGAGAGQSSFDELAFNRFKFKRPSVLTFMQKFDTITREEFVAWYPALLTEVTQEALERSSATDRKMNVGVDIAFKDLSLTVTVKRNEVKIVDGVTGRLQAGTMTALMGGSGAGKTSLLNALCGRAFYGEVTGSVKINGHETTIEEHSSAVGFVPQDDIVYAELTVRENLIFSGRFQLPAGTPQQEIEDLADATMADLGLSRVMHSIVGDVTRRGVSGGEKKRVNIGLELMARPKIVFLDEPTSGLDANSALLVMESLKTLTNVHGTTVCSVIHQPRKFIYELFDSLILLGVGGKMVYHGPTNGALQYFQKLQYELPPGESIADWLIDISSGRLGSQTDSKEQEELKASSKFQPHGDAIKEGDEDSDAEEESSLAPGPSKSFDSKSFESESMDEPLEEPTLEYKQSGLSDKLSKREGPASSTLSFLGMDKSKALSGQDTIFEDPAAQAGARREVLYSKWRSYFAQLSDEAREKYEAPEPYDLPDSVKKPSVWKQIGYQLRRLLVVGGRNWLTKLIDTIIIVAAAVLVSLLDGTEQPTTHWDMWTLNYDFTAEPTSVADVVREFPKLFQYAVWGNVANLQGFSAKLGVLLAVLVALTATKTITAKRKEFFREAASGYSTNAYFVAVNIIATAEHLIQIAIAGLCVIWLRNCLAHWFSWMAAFLLMGWVSISWALLFPLIIPAENVILVTGFYMIVFGLLFSGNIAPVLYENIYNSTFMALFSGLLSPTRYFVEALAVSESRTLPVQSGFTSFGPNFAGEMYGAASFKLISLGLSDFYTVTQRSFDGWYWGVLPALFVGFWVRWMAAGLIHVCDRPKQAKRSILKTISEEPLGFFYLFIYVIVFVGLLALSCYSILHLASAYEDQSFPAIHSFD